MSPRDGTELLKARQEAAEQHLAQGNFRLALAELDAGLELLQRHPGLCLPEGRQALTQLHRQTDLLGDLCAESLEEILRHAAGRQEKEWAADFERRYHNKALLLDCELTRTTRRGYRASYLLALPEERARLDMEDPPALRPLPLESPQRVIFGARLAAVQRERAGLWAVRLDPESVVLFTEPAGLVLSCPALGDDTGLAALQRQRSWLQSTEDGHGALSEK